MTSETGREVHLIARPVGIPRESDFQCVDVLVPRPGRGEVLVRNRWMSVDPSTRIRMDAGTGGSSYMPPLDLNAPLDGMAVGEVVESGSAGYEVGETVFHALGWREYALLPASGPARPRRIEVDDMTPARSYLGPLGFVGLTAYVGLFDIAALREGDVVFVSAAAGAVGSLAVQLAKLSGHTVIGSAGSAGKCAFIREQLGADEAFCYRDGDVRSLLRRAAPDGIDVYFDNVGGHHLEAALDLMRIGGRVALCGAIGDYNATGPAYGPANLFEAVAKDLTLRGFIAVRHANRMKPYRQAIRKWLAEDRIVYAETIVEGLERAPSAFIGLMRGENTGKMLVKVT